MNVDEVIDFIRDIWVKFNNSRRKDFKDSVKPDTWGPISGHLEFRGAYAVFEGDTLVYVGSAGKGNRTLKRRISDLFRYSPGARTDKFCHSLTRKLVRKRRPLKDLEQALSDVRKFCLENCSFQVVETDTMIKLECWNMCSSYY